MFVLSLLAVSHAHAAWQYTRSVNDGSSGNDVTVSGLNFSLNANFTVAGWVRHNTGNFNHGQHDVLMWCDDGDDGFSFVIRGWGDNNRGNLVFNIDGTEVDTGATRPFQGNTSETHIAVRRIGTSLTFWVNGSIVSTTTLSSNTAAVSECWIGSWGGDYLNGNLWNWAIWTRDLSNAEIVSLSQRAAPECYRNGMVLSLPMVTLQELARGGAVTNGSENNSGVTLGAQPRMIFCGE
jgi:hypothetical protein